MLVLTNQNKDFLDENKIEYVEYETSAEVYMNYVLNATMETAMRHNEADITDSKVADKYVKYVVKNADLNKIYTKLEKFEYDALRIMHDALEDKHEEIMKEDEEVANQ